MNNPTVSLIVSTYNWDAALYLCLKSILAQKKLPNEIIIADDGSDFKTKNLIHSFQETFPIPLIHVWHENNGFQLAKIRNRAIKKARFEYIIQIDGDLILNTYFISDHLKFAKKNHFTRGSRVRLGEKTSKKLLESKTINFTLLNKDIDNKLNGIRNYFLAKLLAKPNLNPHKMLGCNMGYWKEDVLKVNGYENLLVGWGHEDEEFAARLVNNNIFKIKLKHYSIVNHIYHEERVRNNEDEHNSFIKNVIEENKKVALNGINELD